LFAWCVRLNQLLVGVQTHLNVLSFHFTKSGLETAVSQHSQNFNHCDANGPNATEVGKITQNKSLISI